MCTTVPQHYAFPQNILIYGTAGFPIFFALHCPATLLPCTILFLLLLDIWKILTIQHKNEFCAWNSWCLNRGEEQRDILKVTFKMFSCTMRVYFDLTVKEKYLSFVICPRNLGDIGLEGATQVIKFSSCNGQNDIVDVCFRRSHIQLSPCTISIHFTIQLVVSFNFSFSPFPFFLSREEGVSVTGINHKDI